MLKLTEFSTKKNQVFVYIPDKQPDVRCFSPRENSLKITGKSKKIVYIPPVNKKDKYV